MKKKIFHLITTLDVGGAENHLLTLLSHMDRERFDLSVGYLKGSGELAAVFRDMGIPVTDFRMRGRVAPVMLMRLIAHLKKLRPHVVHTHLQKADYYGTLAARKAGVPVVVTSKHNEDPHLRTLAFGRMLRKAMDRCDAVITISDALTEYLHETAGVPLAKMHRIHYGLDLEKFDRESEPADLRRKLGLPDEVRLLVTVARYDPQKGLEHLMHAAARVTHQFPDVVFLLIGRSGPEERRLGRLIDELRLTTTVLMTGFREDVAEVLREADVFVLSSLYEGFGLVLIEAMAARLPVVATAVGPIPEIVLNEATGLLVPAGDPEALAAAMRRILTATELARMMGDAGRRRVETSFCAERMVKTTERLYDMLCAAKGV